MIRADILDAAAQVFREKGYHAASMNDIAQAVHLQKASLYHHINSKQEILHALLDRGIDLLHERIAALAGGDSPPSEKLHLCIAAYLETLAEYADLAAVLLFEHRSLDDDLRAAHFPRRDGFERIWRELIQEGVDRGEFVCPDPGLTSKYLLGVLNWTVTWYRQDGPLTSSEIAHTFAKLLLEGLAPRPQPNEAH
jgi:AcrR family transcriptional regulator